MITKTRNIVRHLDEQGLLYDLQRGFHEKWSCETQLIMLAEDLARSASKGKQTDLISLDLKILRPLIRSATLNLSGSYIITEYRPLIRSATLNLSGSYIITEYSLMY